MRRLPVVTLLSALALMGPLCAPARAKEAAPALASVARLHVIAHSDEPRDQAAKMAVFRAVQARVADILASHGKESARGRPAPRGADVAVARLVAHRQEIQDIAGRALREGGFVERPVRVEAGRFLFPATVDPTGAQYPAGWYPAVLVVLGSGQGHNWWCLVFPTTCPLPAEQGMSAPERAQAAAQDRAQAVVGAPDAPGAPRSPSGGPREPWWVRLLPWRWFR